MFRSAIRRARAVVVLAGISAAAWGLLGALMWALKAVERGGLRGLPGSWLAAPWASLGYELLNWSVLGALSGGCAALLLPWVARGRTLGQISVRRLAVLGAAGGTAGMVVPVLVRAALTGAHGPRALGASIFACATFGAASTMLAAALALTRGKVAGSAEEAGETGEVQALLSPEQRVVTSPWTAPATTSHAAPDSRSPRR